MKNLTQNQAFEQFLAECNTQQNSNTQKINTMINQNQTKHIDWNRVMCVVILMILISMLFYGNAKAATTPTDTAITVQSQGRTVYVTQKEKQWLRGLKIGYNFKSATDQRNIRNCDAADIIITLILNKRK